MAHRASKVFGISSETIDNYLDVDTQVNSFNRTLNVRERVIHQMLLSTEKGIATSYKDHDGHLMNTS